MEKKMYDRQVSKQGMAGESYDSHVIVMWSREV